MTKVNEVYNCESYRHCMCILAVVNHALRSRLSFLMKQILWLHQHRWLMVFYQYNICLVFWLRCTLCESAVHAVLNLSAIYSHRQDGLT